MARKPKGGQPFNIMIVGHNGRLQYEALLFVLSLRQCSPTFSGKMVVAQPERGPLWQRDPTMRPDIVSALNDLGAEVVPFQSKHFGEGYPYGNKIEGLATLPADEPFIFFDSDTLITGDIGRLKCSFDRPSASMRREGTWPVEELYWPGYTAIWKSLYDKFDLDFESSLDLTQPDEFWRRYLYFNAGWFLGQDPHAFGSRFTDYATRIKADPPEPMVAQPLHPWLDQVALPLVIHSLGGGRPGPELDGLDGDLSCHYRMFPLLYAREDERAIEVLEAVAAPNRIKRILKDYNPIKRMVYHGQGHKARALFDRNDLPRKEQGYRRVLREKKFWMR
ncbi:hypothetical protein [Flavimaricola marinus]|uniref:Glycosyl transferase family 8 n=1 Tax=Flavimaricola marinus TaxID=1819565 RepID=A0A238LE53_9RHOB|nr:hypothetical protein [Flavimaricola marinus]SMY07675.1 hypothetical protein LOM8899_01814 [Flavimaricola marinus]